MRNSIFFVTMLSFVLGCGSQAQDRNNQVPAKNSTQVVEGRNEDQWQISSDKSLSFRISTEKKKYLASEIVTVRAELRNNSNADASVLPVHAAFGNVGDAIRITGPQEVRYQGPFKSMPPPKKITLSAGTTATAEATIDDRYEGFGVAGEYKITCSFSGMTSTVVITLEAKRVVEKHNQAFEATVYIAPQGTRSSSSEEPKKMLPKCTHRDMFGT